MRKKILIAKLKAQIRLRELMEKRNGRNYGIDSQQTEGNGTGWENNNWADNNVYQEGSGIPVQPGQEAP